MRQFLSDKMVFHDVRLTIANPLSRVDREGAEARKPASDRSPQ